MIKFIICFIQFVVLVCPWHLIAGEVPDTGVSKCYDNREPITCPQIDEAFYGQDAQFEGNGRSYTKLGVNGVALPDTATRNDGWIITREVAKLMKRGILRMILKVAYGLWGNHL